MGDRAFKDILYEQFARIGKAVDSPKRLELLDLLGQGERSVETLAELAGMGVTNTSAHLQVLRQARLVATRKQGTKVLYRLADDQVVEFLAALRALARSRLAEVDQAVHAYLSDPSDPEPISRAELIERLRRGTVVLLDVRPPEEYAAGHLPGALSVPFDRLEAAIATLPADAEIVAYCRGPYCLYAPRAVRMLRRHGFRARRLEDGVAEWRLAGQPLERAS